MSSNSWQIDRRSMMIGQSLSRLRTIFRQQHQHHLQQQNNFRLLADRDKQRRPWLHQLRTATARKSRTATITSILVGVFILFATYFRITSPHHDQHQFLFPSSSIATSTATATRTTTTFLTPAHHHHGYGRRDNADEENSMSKMQLLLSSYLLHPMTAANKNRDDLKLEQDIAVRLPPPIVAVEGRGGGVKVVDCVFAMALGSTIQDVMLFVTSLRDTGFVGDVVLGVLPYSHRDMSDELWEYLISVNEDYNAGVSDDGQKKKKKMNVIVYTLSLYVNPRQTKSFRHGRSFYYNTTSQKYVGDVRPFYRTFSQLRYEHYASWLFSLHDVEHQNQNYKKYYGRIMLTDLRDVYFQKNPFNELPSHTEMKNTLMVFEEYPTKIIDQRWNREWIRTARGRNALKEIGENNNVSCSGTTIGGYNAIVTYLIHMIRSFDESPQCNHVTGCDQGHHNFLVYSGRLTDSSTTTDEIHRIQGPQLPTQISKIIVGKQGYSIVNTLGLLAKREDIYHKGEQIITPLRSLGILDNKTDHVLNWDGSISPILHQYDRDPELKSIIDQRGKNLVRQWKQRRKTDGSYSTSSTTKTAK